MTIPEGSSPKEKAISQKNIWNYNFFGKDYCYSIETLALCKHMTTIILKKVAWKHNK